MLLFTDGSASLVVGADPARKVVFLKDPSRPAEGSSVPVDELRLSEVWAGEAVLLRKIRGYGETDALFNFRWLIDLVPQERSSLRDIETRFPSHECSFNLPAAIGYDDGEQGAPVP